MRVFVLFALPFLLANVSFAEDAHSLQKKNQKRCREESLPLFREYVEKKIAGGNHCDKNEDCVYLIAGEGYVLNRKVASTHAACILKASGVYAQRCRDKYPKPEKESFISIPPFEGLNFPSRLLCISNRCVAQYGSGTKNLARAPHPGLTAISRCEAEANAIFRD